MSYNRLGSPANPYDSEMDQRRPGAGRTPSPGQPLRGYQLEDRYASPAPAPSTILEIPMGPNPAAASGDRLPLQPSYSVENIPYSAGNYHDDYDPRPQRHDGDYSLDPQAHHDQYYHQPYDPSPNDESPHHGYGTEPTHYWQDEDVNRPMIHSPNAYGPDPHEGHDEDMDPENPFSDEPAPTPSPAPIKRWKTVKEVQLFKGNLVLDCPIPPRLLNQVPHAQPPERDEFTHMRYSAATCDPADFDAERFTLRQKLFAKPRHTELFIVVTMYNEEDELFARTMIGVIKNIEYMNSRTNSKTWGKDAWKKIVVCVVSDGRAKINPRTRAVLAALGVYQDGIAKQQVNGKDVTAHIYEYTTQMTLDIKKGVVGVKKGNTPVQMLFCLKEKNQKKINSHRWFFQAFGTVLDPNICVLIDAGTKPGKDSVYQLWKAFDLEPMCAGACGEIKAMLETCLSPDSVVRTRRGPKAIRDIVVGDQLFDHHDRPVQCLAADPIKTSPDMKKVIYTGYTGLAKTSFTCTPDHILTLVANGVTPHINDKGRGVVWWTRCDRSELKKDVEELKWERIMHQLYTEIAEQIDRPPTDAEVRQYLKDITAELEDGSSQTGGLKDSASPGLYKLLDQLEDADVDIDDTDLSMVRLLLEEHMDEYLEQLVPEQDEVPEGEEIFIDLDANRKKIGSIALASSSRLSDGTYRQTSQIASSSPLPIRSSRASSSKSFELDQEDKEKLVEVREKLDNPTAQSRCKGHPHCKGLRKVQIRFANETQAQLVLTLLSGDDYREVDPCAVQAGEVFEMTMDQYLKTCTPPMQLKNKKLRLYRAPLVFEPYQGLVSPVPVDPYFLGFWLGDGSKHITSITSSDPELKVYLQAYVDRLNRTFLDGQPDLCVQELHKWSPGDTTSIKGQLATATLDCFVWTIASTVKYSSWNPVRQGLKDVGLFDDKSGGIPDCYMNADEDTRLAVLAGLIESDGSLSTKTQCYCFTQATFEHKKIVEDAHRLATSCGIHCTDITTKQKAEDAEPTWLFYMGKGSEKFQHHLLLPRKRLDLTGRERYNRDMRPFEVEDAGPGEYRLIEVSGALFQLADRTVIHNCGKKLLNPLVATQNFEYKMSNILDKPLESAFGFITVLPGAFSAYRYVALQNDKAGQGPLEKYFAGEKMHGANAGIFTANMYLAEDRILCFELVSKRNCHWILQYVKSATGETDVPTTMSEFISQRRRWLNGSFFAAVYALAHSFDIFRSDHSFMRKMMFLVEFVYQTISMLFAWFALGNFFLVFRILTASLQNELGTPGKVLFIIFEWLYIAVLITCFILALGNRPQGSNKWYMSMVYFWCVIMAYLMFASVFIAVKSVQKQIAENKGFEFADLFRDKIFATMIISLLSTYVMWLLVSIIFLDPWHMFTSFFQYLLMTPTYINILNVYAFCNTHDITWGTKGDDKPEKLPSVTTKADGKADIQAPTDDADLNTQYETELRVFSSRWKEDKKIPSASEKQEDYYRGFRSGVVLFWMFCNLGLTALVLQSGGLELTVSNPDEAQKKQTETATIYLAVVLYSVAGLAAFRFIGAMWFLVVRMFRGV